MTPRTPGLLFVISDAKRVLEIIVQAEVSQLISLLSRRHEIGVESKCEEEAGYSEVDTMETLGFVWASSRTFSRRADVEPEHAVCS